MGDYKIEDIYQGGYSSFKPTYGDVFTGYRASAGSLGLTTDPRTANVLQDASVKLNTGAKQIELALVDPQIFDSIPQQQLKELNRLSKLTGAGVSMHGVVINSTGLAKEGYSEMNREDAERRITDVLLRSHDLNPDGGSPVTFHAGEGIPGSEWKTLGDKGKEREAKRIVAVDKESGKMIPLDREEKFYPGKDLSKPIVYTPKENLKIVNETEWDNKISQLFFNKERADEILEKNQVQIAHLLNDLREKKTDPSSLTPTQQDAYNKFSDAQNYLNEINKTANGIFSKAYQYGNQEQREELKKISEEYKRDLDANKESVSGASKAMHKLLINLQDSSLAPEMFVPIEDFATGQSAKTFGNAAFNAYKKFGNTAPILTIENPPAGFGMSTGEDLRNLVVKSREEFTKKARENGASESEAKKLAEKFIGATWDVGHINMLRGQGFKEEDIIKETEKVAPFVKHVHLSDNFGFEHTELPMGMGNVPLKKIMDKLGQQGFDAKKIIEAGNWWQHFRTPPFQENLEALGSPVYSMNMGPYWNQALGGQQGYFGGYGMMLPNTNYETFGAGFSRLPAELGGQRPGAEGSRMSGRGME
jgi:hypothetical protein